MGKMQEALRKAEEARSRRAGTGGRDAPVASAGGTGTATSFAISAALTGGEVDPHLVALTEPGSSLAEQYRTVRTNLLALSNDKPLKILVVTSAVPNEGKSVTTLNLAATMAEEVGRRVVVVDADLRKPTLHRYLGIENQRG